MVIFVHIQLSSCPFPQITSLQMDLVIFAFYVLTLVLDGFAIVQA